MNFYTLFPTVLNMSITASVATVVIIVLRKIFKNMPKIIFYFMWLVVLFRLLCPVSIASGFSLLNILNVPATLSGSINRMEYIPQNIVHTEYPQVDLPLPLASDIVNHFIPQGKEQLVADPLQGPVAMISCIWLLGIASVALYSLYSYIKLRRKLDEAVKREDNIYLCDHISSPFVVGFIKPRIYLPSSLDNKEKSYIILHEKHHIKRLDHIIKLIAFAALCVHWFNPFVWIAFDLLCKDMEMSCDEAVLKQLGGDIKADYCASLLNLTVGKHIFAGTPLAFGEGDTAARIENMYHFRKPEAYAFIAVAAVCVLLSVTLLLNPDNSNGQIYYNGTVYIQSGKAQGSGVTGSTDIGSIADVIDKKTEFSENLTAKNIGDRNIGMPVFQNKDNPYELWLTTGDGWVPFTAKGMSYETSDSWITVKNHNGKTRISFSCDESVNEIAIYEDVYRFGELLYSSMAAYSNIRDGDSFEREGNEDLYFGYSFEENKLSVYFDYYENGVVATRYVDLPQDSYGGYLTNTLVTSTKQPLLANDSIDLLYAVLSSYEDARIYTNYKNKENDTVIVYRLVTRSQPTR